MKDIVKVSISGIAFIFDDDAYRVVKEYLDKLEAGYAKNPDGREIVADIEARIAELILSEQDSEKIVDKQTAESIVSQLGYPDDIDTDTEVPVENIPRRLFRNPDGAMIAGVCSGIGTYFRIDPLWVRLGIFAPLILSILMNPFHFWHMSSFFGSLFGVFILLYFILWIVIPMARNPRQKLEMRGEKITASTIKQELNEVAQNVSSSVKSERAVSVWGDLMYGVGKVLQVLMKVFVIFFAFIFGIVAISLFIALLAFIFGTSLIPGVVFGAFSGFVGVTPAVYVILLLLLVLIPIISICYSLIRLLFGSKNNKPFMSIMGIIWLIILIFTIVISARNAHSIRDGVKYIIEEEGGIRQRIYHDSDDWDEEGWKQQWDNYTPETETDQENSSPQWHEQITEPEAKSKESNSSQKKTTTPNSTDTTGDKFS